jgi:hypothetical protein
MSQTTMARPHVPRRTVPPIALVVLALVGALLCGAMAYALRDPAVVSSVTIENPSPLDVNVSVQSSKNSPRLLLQPVGPTTSATTRGVLDQGDEWIFSFSSAGVDGGTVRVSRAKLSADGWRLKIPQAVIDRLRSGTFVPAYER